MTLKPTIINITHNDLDAVGCCLCIKEKFNDSADIVTLSSNYKNLPELFFQAEEMMQSHQHNVKVLYITDLSFAENKHLLLRIKDICEENSVKIIFIDHHQYPENYFEELEDTNFKIFYDENYSASMNTFNSMKFDESSPRIQRLKKLITVIDTYDIWREEKGKLFEISSDLNTYFWVSGRLKLVDKFYYNDYNLPNDFQEVTSFQRNEADAFYKKLISKNLIFSPSNNISFGFVDDHFNYCVSAELKKHKCFIIASSFGVLRFRFSKAQMGGFEDAVVQRIKTALLEGEIRGHLHSFSSALDVSDYRKVVDKFKHFYSIINDILKDEGIE